MKKKCISIITCIIMLIGCVNFSVCAADNPSYLYDESENFDVMPAGNNIPGNIEILHLPIVCVMYVILCVQFEKRTQ